MFNEVKKLRVQRFHATVASHMHTLYNIYIHNSHCYICLGSFCLCASIVIRNKRDLKNI